MLSSYALCRTFTPKKAFQKFGVEHKMASRPTFSFYEINPRIVIIRSSPKGRFGALTPSQIDKFYFYKKQNLYGYFWCLCVKNWVNGEVFILHPTQQFKILAG